MKEQIHHLRINNIDIRSATWITYYFYKFTDKEILKSVKIERIRKSENSINLLITFIIEYGIGKSFDRGLQEIKKMLKRWQKKKDQTNLKMFLDDKRV